MDTTRDMIEWISQQEHFTYVQFSKKFNIPYNQVKKVFTKKLKKYHYKLRKNCLVYHRVTKIEEVNIEVGSYNLAYKVHCSKEFFYIPKHIVSIYGMPIIGSYFSPLHFLTIKSIKIELVYVISFLTRKKFYTIFKLSDDLENWEKRYNWKIVLKKFNAKYKFKNNVAVIRTINLLKGNSKCNSNTNNKITERKLKLKAIDLFAGIGGFHIACKENNIDVVWASEIDKFARTQYQLNHGLIPQGDITKLNVEEIPKHDLLCAGFPCQAFSNAGKKMGLEDTRGTLFYEIARIVTHHKTPYFLLENVPNLLSINNGEIIKVIQDVFQELGYYLKIKILNAADFGLGQLRKRVFIVGFLDKEKYFRFSFPPTYEYKVVLKDILEEEVDEKYFIKNEKIFRYIEKKSSGTAKFKGCKVDPKYACTLMARQYASWDGNYITDQIL